MNNVKKTNDKTFEELFLTCNLKSIINTIALTQPEMLEELFKEKLLKAVMKTTQQELFYNIKKLYDLISKEDETTSITQRTHNEELIKLVKSEINGSLKIYESLLNALKEAYIKDKNQEALDSVSAKIFELETIMKELNSLGINLNTINQFNQTKK
ncbi:MAG: hypothetical protein HFJ11_05730 [Bacilli bacterium]|nr:hypothetical protein [Bacilli bacterium]